MAVCAVMASGCTMGEGDVFTIYADGGGCWTDKDCPRVECHRAPSCLSGRCRVLAQPKPTTCSIGICNEDAVCMPCEADAECEAVNGNDCYTLVCDADGKCAGRQLPAGVPCNINAGTCSDSAHCIP